jgi:UDP-N-acetylglucosamine 2-epimerase (non-hydrolysing)
MNTKIPSPEAEGQGRMIDIIAGARPNFIKIAPIIRALEARRAAGSALRWRLIHTGQHYDARMSGEFFRQLEIPSPQVNLEAGSGTQAEQTAAIMVRYESLLLQQHPALCLVVGDVTSTMACAIAAQKLGIPVAHVEGGIRSGDWTMPEEINRLVTDAITNWFFTTSEFANVNLQRAGVDTKRIFFVGNTMIDTLLANLHRTQAPEWWNELSLQIKGYDILTLHRPSNVDKPEVLEKILAAVAAGAGTRPVVFPAHPRTAKVLARLEMVPSTLHIVEPQPYLEFIHLVRNSRAVITDSGGITEETTALGIPCITLRDTTERPETVTVGTNELVGTDPQALARAYSKLNQGAWKKGAVPERWDGRTGERIAAILDKLLTAPSREALIK